MSAIIYLASQSPRRSQLLMDLSLNLKALVSQRLIPKQDGKGRVAAVEANMKLAARGRGERGVDGASSGGRSSGDRSVGRVTGRGPRGRAAAPTRSCRG